MFYHLSLYDNRYIPNLYSNIATRMECSCENLRIGPVAVLRSSVRVAGSRTFAGFGVENFCGLWEGELLRVSKWRTFTGFDVENFCDFRSGELLRVSEWRTFSDCGVENFCGL